MTPSAALATIPPDSTLSVRHEAFVQALMTNGGHLRDAYRTVYPNASEATVWVNACKVRARPDVHARIAELQAIGARNVIEHAEAMARHLFEVGYLANPAALSRVVAVPCAECWPSPEVIATAVDRHIAGIDASPPNLREPRPDCVAPASAHVSVEITPTDQLSGADRALFLAAKQGRYGIEVILEDRQAARAELHRLLGLITSKSESKSLNVNASITAADTSPDALLAGFHKLRLASAPPVANGPGSAPNV